MYEEIPSLSDDDTSSLGLPSPRVDTSTDHAPDLYVHRWFRKLVLLIYCLSLSLAADFLYAFAYFDGLTHFQRKGPLLLQQCGKWMGLNAIMIWLFAIVGVSVTDWPSTTHSHTLDLIWRKYLAPWRSLQEQIRPGILAWLTAIAWNGLVIVLTAASTISGYFIFKAKISWW